MKYLLIALFLFSSFVPCFSQDKASAKSATEYQLRLLAAKLYSSGPGTGQDINQQLLIKFDSVLNEPNSFENYQFDSLKKDLSILRSPDNKFRIIHWHMEKADGTFEYFGFIQSRHTEIKKTGFMRKTRTESVQLYPLTDRSSEIKNPENAITDHRKWYGMRYYKIIHNRSKSRDYYTLLGWDGNDKFSQKKIIDVLTFDNKGLPRFGADIFNFEKKYPKRVIFEYGANCSMPLKYSSKKDSIIFGHLAPLKPSLEGQYQYYCCDMSFDGFGFKKGKWNYGKDLDAVNEKDDNDKFYGDPHDRTITNSQSNKVVDRRKKKKRSGQ
ncbi:MAG TPA: hypothetical protein VF868_08825 [Bacteroidia bacterium]|jgi:hypothetical protein